MTEPPASPPDAARLGLRDPYARDERGAASSASGDPYVAYAPMSRGPSQGTGQILLRNCINLIP
jgi:hypothetical protein